MVAERSHQRLIRLGVLSLSVTGALLNMRLKSLVDPEYSSAHLACGKALLSVLTSPEYISIPHTDYHRLLQCFILSIDALTSGLPADDDLHASLSRFVYATAQVFSDPEQDGQVLNALLGVILAGYNKLQMDISLSTTSDGGGLQYLEGERERELHAALFRHLYVTVKRLERILGRWNERRRAGMQQAAEAGLGPVSVTVQ